MTVLVVTGTGTEVGKTVTTAALAATALAAGRSVAVLKPAQTGVAPGEPGDADEVARLAGDKVTTVELTRFPEPLAPATAARRAGLAAVDLRDIVRTARKLATEHDLVLVEGAGGLLVRLATHTTVADVARELSAPVLIVASAGLGTLSTTALTAEALRARHLTPLGVVVGSWPDEPDLAARCNLTDFPDLVGAPLLGAIPERAASRTPSDFRARSGRWLAPVLGGVWDANGFTAREGQWRAAGPSGPAHLLAQSPGG